MTLGIILMLGVGADSPPAQLVWQAQQAATLDLIHLLRAISPARLILSSPDFSWLPPVENVILEPDLPGVPFHFGTRLAELIQKHDLETALYFGGGSVPLLNADLMRSIFETLLSENTPLVLTNNRHSSDWAAIRQTDVSLIRQVNRDNSLAWYLGEKGYPVKIVAENRPAVHLDIDTPTDLAILRLHSETQPHLKQFLAALPQLEVIPLPAVMDTLRRDASQVTLIGRVSPQAWLALNRVTRCWIRVFAEERGMVASERLKKGEVRSVLTELYTLQGAEKFFKLLASMSDAVIIDSRVLMAAHYQFLPEDRFASDLFMRVDDPWLDEFTQAAKNAPIPVLLGGHSVVAGGLYAIAEMLNA